MEEPDLVVLANEVGGRWSLETQAVLPQLSRAKSREEPPHLPDQRQTGMDLAMEHNIGLRESLLENRGAQGFDGPTPTTAEVIGDSRYVGFA